MKTSYPIVMRWADFDPNGHLRHTLYSEYCGAARWNYLQEKGVRPELLAALNVGPILFKEETVYFREIRMEDKVEIITRIAGLSKNGDRWKIEHDIIKNGEILAAKHSVLGTWLDLKTRKLGMPPEAATKAFSELEQHENFEEIKHSK